MEHGDERIRRWDTGDPAVYLVPVDWLKPHEEILAKNANKLQDMTLRWGGYTKPLLVDSLSGCILDGHHRYRVAIELELQRVPALLYDYLVDDSIKVEAWPASGRTELSKQEVIDMAQSSQLFSPKTSRHIVEGEVPPILVPLDVLRQES